MSLFAGEYEKFYELARRAVEAHQLSDPATPKEFAAWVERIGYKMPHELLDQIQTDNKPMEEKELTENTGHPETGQEPENAIPQNQLKKLPWINKARELANSIKRDHPKRGQVAISKEVHTLMVKLNITGRGNRVPTPDTIKREALKGL